MAILRKLDIRPESVESIYSYYRKKMLLVNRKYQRKLVWGIEEKEKFIDSIFNGLPIPLILVAITKYKDTTVYEIIDGMQRLNAIVSFIQNEIHLANKYFNLDTLALTKALKDTGKIEQKEPKLTIEECLEITSYQLPFSISSYDKEADIEEIFRRINSYGKTLSSHELRQAGSTGTFTQIVRAIAENIRKDVSPSDKILLGNMRRISLSNRGLSYGIDLREVFWHKQNILTENNIRASRDEEIIAHLVIAMLLDYDINISSTSLDRAYGLSDDNEENIETEELIKRYGGSEFVKLQFESIYQEIQNTLDAFKFNFRTLLFRQPSKYMNNAFQVVFLAFHNLLVKEQLKIDNYRELNKELNGIGDKYITPHIEEIRHRAARKRVIDSISGVIRKRFSKRGETDPVLSNGVVKLESLLSASKTENSSYDFKQGFYQMDKESKNIKEKVIRTLCSFVNLGRNAVGYVVIGVGETEQMAKKFEEYYSSKPLKFNDFFINGVDAECQKRYNSLDEYRTKFEQLIKSSDIQPEYYKTQILKNIDLFNYREKSIMILKIESKEDPLKLNGKFYHRQGTSTEEVPSSSEKELWSLFLK
ncbi:DUF262 domain-containing protein [uncultured Algoriphagus sp.]|uniref:GmrSD restriction endonuclease domain-containing protein n=1 Tax=uncultured Algoriphagus sp. TaxID=417365 RepID=UPI0030EEB4C8|tara:strand:+ start:525 stop:2297 length:1773 start_codon:yes stop_codon:yes gene_type:complete